MDFGSTNVFQDTWNAFTNLFGRSKESNEDVNKAIEKTKEHTNPDSSYNWLSAPVEAIGKDAVSMISWLIVGLLIFLLIRD
jgi:hypothetical protein